MVSLDLDRCFCGHDKIFDKLICIPNNSIEKLTIDFYSIHSWIASTMGGYLAITVMGAVTSVFLYIGSTNSSFITAYKIGLIVTILAMAGMAIDSDILIANKGLRICVDKYNLNQDRVNFIIVA